MTGVTTAVITLRIQAGAETTTTTPSTPMKCAAHVVEETDLALVVETMGAQEAEMTETQEAETTELAVMEETDQ